MADSAAEFLLNPLAPSVWVESVTQYSLFLYYTNGTHSNTDYSPRSLLDPLLITEGMAS